MSNCECKGTPDTLSHTTIARALEDRVRVLERIVTDKGYDVATQIEALRDQRTVEGADSGVPLSIKTGEKA